VNTSGRGTSAVLTEQVAGGALREIIERGGGLSLPEARPSLRPVPLERIVSESDLQTRRPFNPDGDAEDAELVESVREAGVRVPVHLQDQDDGTYRIRSGHRRVSAARLAGLGRVSAIVWPPGSDVFESAVDTWLENLHRKDLSPLERANMLLLLMDRFDLPRSPETATRLGLSKTTFYRYVGLIDTPADVRDALAKGALGVALAERIGGVEAPDVRANLIQAAEDGVPAGRIDEALSSVQSGEAIPEGLLGGEAPARRDPGRGGEQGPREGWWRNKVMEFGRTLGLGPADLEPVARALKARRISGPHATAAALLVAAGESGKKALADVAAIDPRGLRAIEALYKIICKPSPGADGQGALRRILGFLESRPNDTKRPGGRT
jgi:ParB family chromosome partitioning protein